MVVCPWPPAAAAPIRFPHSFLPPSRAAYNRHRVPFVIVGSRALLPRPRDLDQGLAQRVTGDVITGYLRPRTLDEALALAARADAVVLGGGTAVNAHPGRTPVVAVDLQALDLDGIRLDAHRLRLGATTRLQELVDSDLVPDVLRELARLEAPSTIRNAATVGGTIGRASPESPLLTGLLAYGASVSVARVGASAEHPLDVILDDRHLLDGSIITHVTVPLGGHAAAHRTARTPADSPIVMAVACHDANGAVQVAVSGVESRPVLVDRGRPGELGATGDFRGSSAYRSHLASVLVARALADLGGSERA
jgi:putative selenate reductase FAD-binding subunit